MKLKYTFQFLRITCEKSKLLGTTSSEVTKKMTVVLRLFIFQMQWYNKNQFEDGGKSIYYSQK